MGFVQSDQLPQRPVVPAEQRAADVAYEIARQGNDVLIRERNGFIFAYENVWRNADPDLTPAVMLAALGTKAMAALQQSAATYAHLVAMGETVAPAYGHVPDGVVLTPHADGSVTLGS